MQVVNPDLMRLSVELEYALKIVSEKHLVHVYMYSILQTKPSPEMIQTDRDAQFPVRQTRREHQIALSVSQRRPGTGRTGEPSLQTCRQNCRQSLAMLLRGVSGLEKHGAVQLNMEAQAEEPYSALCQMGVVTKAPAYSN
eukprot:scpid80254/ scgid28279/ 